MRMLLIGLLFAGIALGAPTIKEKPKPKERVHPGDWVLIWNGSKYAMTLGDKGVYDATPGNWYGNWHFDPESSRLTICESCNGLTWSTYTWEIDAEGKGKCVSWAVNGETKEPSWGPSIAVTASADKP